MARDSSSAARFFGDDLVPNYMPACNMREAMLAVAGADVSSDGPVRD